MDIKLKLIDFFGDPELTELRFRMGAGLVSSFAPDPLTAPLTPAEIELLGGGGGIEVKLDQLKIEPDGTLSYRGQRVVLHIRDLMRVRDDQDLPRFHVSYCDTLETMRANKRWHRYVVANPTLNEFTINWIETTTITKIERLDVCQPCLIRLGWNGFSYSSMNKKQRREVVTGFTLAEFFSRYPKDLFSVLPKYKDTTAPINNYPPDWAEIRAKKINSANSTCERCNLTLNEEKTKWLHVHHEDGDKTNSTAENLKVLCLGCHANEPLHAHMKATKDYMDFVTVFSWTGSN
jgi:hypothetical protein